MLGGRGGPDRIPGRALLPVLMGREPPGDELRVVLHPADQRGAAGVLPGEAEKVEAGDVSDTAAVAQAMAAMPC